MWDTSVFIRDQSRPIPLSQVVGPSASPPPKRGTSYMRAHSMRNNNQILHGDQKEANFYTVGHEC